MSDKKLTGLPEHTAPNDSDKRYVVTADGVSKFIRHSTDKDVFGEKNKDTILDEGGTNEVSAEEIAIALLDIQDHEDRIVLSEASIVDHETRIATLESTPSSGPAIAETYADIAARDADVANLTAGEIVEVTDASADATVTSGYAYYEFEGGASFRKLSEEESMDLEGGSETFQTVDPAAIDINSDPSFYGKFSASANTTLVLSNVVDGSAVFKITKTTASDITITFDTNFTNQSGGSAKPDIVLQGALNSNHYIGYFADGTVLEWRFSTTPTSEGITEDDIHRNNTLNLNFSVNSNPIIFRHDGSYTYLTTVAGISTYTIEYSTDFSTWTTVAGFGSLGTFTGWVKVTPTAFSGSNIYGIIYIERTYTA